MSQTTKTLLVGIVMAVGLVGCGRQAEQRLASTEGWSYPDDVEVPEVNNSLTSADWKRIDPPVTTRPDPYAGKSMDNEDAGVHRAGGMLFVDSHRETEPEPPNTPSPYLPEAATELVDVVGVDPTTGAHSHLPDLVEFAGSLAENNIHWMAGTGDRLVVAFGSHVVVRDQTGAWKKSLEIDAESEFNRKHGVLGDSVFATLQRDNNSTEKLWRWRHTEGWTAIHSTADAVKLLRSRNAGAAILVKTDGGTIEWSRSGGDSWQELDLQEPNGGSEQFQSNWEIERAYATSDAYFIAPFYSDSEDRSIWRSTDMTSWTKQPAGSPEIRFGARNAESADGALFLPSDENYLGPGGAVITSAGRREISLPQLTNTLDNPGAEILELHAVDNTWVATTTDSIWVSDDLESGWQKLELRLPAPDKLETIGSHLVFHQESYAHLQTGTDAAWTTHPVVSLDENEDTTEQPLPDHDPVVGDADQLFVLSSEPSNDPPGPAKFASRVNADGTIGSKQPLDFGELEDDSISRSVTWREVPTTYQRQLGLVAAQNGFADWQEIGPALSGDTLESIENSNEKLGVVRMIPFDDRLYGVSPLGPESGRAIVRWNAPDEVAIDVHEIRTKASVEAGESREFTTPVSLYRTDEVLIVRTENRPSPSALGPSPISPKPYLVRSSGGPWAWFLWRQPPGHEIIKDPERKHTQIIPGPHALFVLSEGPLLFRYNPASKAWAKLPLPPTTQRLSPAGFAVSPDSSKLYFGGSRGGIWRLELR